MTPQYIPHHTQPCHIIPVYYSAFLCDVVFVLGGHKEVPDGVASLEINLDSQLTTYIFKTFV